jgi:hypothetical protein
MQMSNTVWVKFTSTNNVDMTKITLKT